MDKLVYYGFRLILWIFSWIPFWLLHQMANGLAFVLHRVVRYRYRVVYGNLKKAFPQKTEKEIKNIIKKTYLNLADVMLEGIKGHTVGTNELIKRYKIVIPQTLQDYFAEGQSIIMVGGHYTNWEWGTVCGGVQFSQLILCYYKPIKNPYIDRFFRGEQIQDRNMLNIPIKSTLRAFVKYRKQAVGHLMIADQSPTHRDSATWIPFLNQDTACLNGYEKLAKRFNYPIFFIDFHRVKRGYYRLVLSELVKTPQTMAEGEIVQLFMKKLEQRIVETPENWLWSHKRWKKKRTA